MKFWIPWGIAALVTGGITAGSMFLKIAGRPGLGALLALILALPGLLAGLFILLILITQPRWN